MKPRLFNEALGGLLVAEPEPRLAWDETALGQSLKIEVQRSGCAMVVRLCGCAGILEGQPLRTVLEKLAGEKVPIIILDLSALDFIGAAGLGAFIAAYLKAREHRTQMRIVAPQLQVLEVLQRTCLVRLFPIHFSVAEAVAA